MKRLLLTAFFFAHLIYMCVAQSAFNPFDYLGKSRTELESAVGQTLLENRYYEKKKLKSGNDIFTYYYDRAKTGAIAAKFINDKLVGFNCTLKTQIDFNEDSFKNRQWLNTQSLIPDTAQYTSNPKFKYFEWDESGKLMIELKDDKVLRVSYMQ